MFRSSRTVFTHLRCTPLSYKLYLFAATPRRFHQQNGCLLSHRMVDIATEVDRPVDVSTNSFYSEDDKKYKIQFVKAQDRLKEDLINYPGLDDVPLMTNRLKKFLYENLQSWDFERASLMIKLYLELPRNRNHQVINTSSELDDLFTLAWSYTLYEIYTTYDDDIIDNSKTRFGKPTWFYENDQNMVASYDILLLHHSARFLLNKYFGSRKDYFAIQKMFTDFVLGVLWSCLHDTHFTLAVSKNPNKYDLCTIDVWSSYVPYKSSAFILLPIRLVLRLIDLNIDKYEDLYLNRAGYFLGILMQTWDDYLDIYHGPHAFEGDQGDISEGRMTALLIVALEHCNDFQRQQLLANYGHHDEQKVEIVKRIYKELDVETKIKAYEAKLTRILDEEIKNFKNPTLRSIFKQVCHLVHQWHY